MRRSFSGLEVQEPLAAKGLGGLDKGIQGMLHLEGGRGEGTMLRYGPFIAQLLEDLIVAVQEAEDMGFHHQPGGSSEFGHYQRLVQMASHCTERMAWYNAYAKKPIGRKDAAPTG